MIKNFTVEKFQYVIKNFLFEDFHFICRIFFKCMYCTECSGVEVAAMLRSFGSSL